MSRFFIGDSDTEDSLSDYSDNSLSDHVDDNTFTDSSDDDSQRLQRHSINSVGPCDETEEVETQVRVVKSAKAMRLEALGQALTKMSSGRTSGDWVSVQTAFDRANKVIQKGNVIPRAYIGAFLELEPTVHTALNNEKSASKKMDAPKAKALRWLGQKIKKNRSRYENDIRDYHLGLDDDGESEESGTGEVVIGDTEDDLLKTLQQVADARGKKNTDREKQVSILEALLLVALTPEKKIRVLMSLIFALLDTATDSSSGVMSIPTWKKTENHLGELLEVLETHQDDTMDSKIVHLQGSIAALVERLDDEFTKSLQKLDPRESDDYVGRLRDEAGLYALIVQSVSYFIDRGMTDEACRTSLRRLEHIYYKPDPGILDLEKTVEPNKDPSDLTNEICSYLYKNGSAAFRSRATLYQVYHHAIHDRFFAARDLLLASHLQETIHQANVPAKIMYNRTMAQIGLCAFRQGMIMEAQESLREFFSGKTSTGARVKALLGQDQTQVPFHMHINQDLIECVYLTSSMLLEVPMMVSAVDPPLSSSSFQIWITQKKCTTPFQHMLETYSRHIFLGPPPETMREHIFSASNALAAGNWQECIDLIFTIKIWGHPMLSTTGTTTTTRLNPEQAIKAMLHSKIQEEGLRVFLLSNSSNYATIGLDQLAGMFELSRENVVSIVSKMIGQDEIQSRVDLHRGVVVVNHVKHNQVQLLTLALAASAVGLVEGNEKLKASLRKS